MKIRLRKFWNAMNESCATYAESPFIKHCINFRSYEFLLITQISSDYIAANIVYLDKDSYRYGRNTPTLIFEI